MQTKETKISRAIFLLSVSKLAEVHMKFIYQILIFCSTLFVINAAEAIETYKRHSIGFEISNPHNLYWFEPEMREKIIKTNRAGREDEYTAEPKMLLVLGFGSDKEMEGAMSINVINDVDMTKPLRYHLGKVLSKLESRMSTNATIEGDYRRTSVGGADAIYFKGKEKHEDYSNVTYIQETHMFGFYHKGNLFFIQSGLSLLNSLPKEKLEKYSSDFETKLKDTIRTIKLNQ